MKRVARGLGFGIAVVLGAQSCKTPADSFACQSNSECNAFQGGVCEKSVCVYPDGTGGNTGSGGNTGDGGSSGGGNGGSSGGGNGGSSGGGNGGSSGGGGKGSGGSGGIATNGGTSNGGSGGSNPDGGVVGGDLTVVAGKIGGNGTVDGTGNLARFATPGCLAFDGDHYLYTGDMYAETIRRIDTTTGAVTTIAGYPFGSGSTDGIGAEARFYRPQCVHYDASDAQNPALFVSEWSGARIRKLTLKDNAVSLIAGSSDGEIGYVDASGAAARFEGPAAMARRGDFLYVADFYNNALRAINLTTKAVTTVIGDPATKPAGETDGPIATARLTKPVALAFDSTGNKLFIGEHYPGERVRVLDFTNNTVSTLITSVGVIQSLAYDATKNRLLVTLFEDQKVVAVNVAPPTISVIAGSGQPGEVDGPPTAAKFYSPHGVALGPNGAIFVSDFDGPTLRKLVANGSGAYQTTTFAGLAAPHGLVDAIGEEARFESPGDMALAPDNHTIYLVDADTNCAIRTFDTGSKQVGTLAGGGGCNHADGTGTAATFNYPNAMTMAVPAGGGAPLLLVTEGRGVVRKVDTANGKVTTLFAGNDDLPAWRGIAATTTTIYVAGEFERKIYQLPIGGGALTDYAGTGGQGCNDSSAAISSLGRPGGILWDGASSLYFADQECQKIRRINLSNNTIQTVAGGNGDGDENPDGIGKGAAFSFPGSLTWDRQKKGFYVQDMHQVRWVDVTTFEVKTIAGTSGVQGGVWLPPNPIRFNFPGGMIEGTDGELYISSEGAILEWTAP